MVFWEDKKRSSILAECGRSCWYKIWIWVFVFTKTRENSSQCFRQPFKNSSNDVWLPSKFFKSPKLLPITHAIVSFFLSPDLSMKISNFSKTVYTIFLKFCTVIQHPKGPVCAKASKSSEWDARSIAKISPKMTKKYPIFDFSDFLKKLSIRFERNVLLSFCTIKWSYMCNFNKFVCLGFERVRRKKT